MRVTISRCNAAESSRRPVPHWFQTNRPALTAVVVMATIPILVLYIFFQRYFTAGIAASGVKG
jgi:ABC-type glycerol-3-phosphate transport system permease component